MRLSALLREAVRDISSGTTRYFVFSLALLALVGGLVCVDTGTVLQQISAANRFHNSGAATQILAAAGQIDGAACDRLKGISGVRQSGAVRESTKSITISALPGAPVPEHDVTPGFPNVLSATPSHGAGLVLSEEVAQPLGVKAGDRLSTALGDFLVSATYNYPSDGRQPGFGYAELSVTTDQKPFDQCWVETWPQIKNAPTLLLMTLIPGSTNGDSSTEQPSLSQLNSSLGATYAGSDLFQSRTTRYVAPLTFLLAIGIGFLSIWIRRLQMASALHGGVAKRDLVGLALMESLAWSFPVTLIGSAIAVGLVHALPASDRWPLLFTELSVPLAALCGVSVGSLVAIASTREKLLFRIFKDR